MARAGRRKHGSQHGLPEPDCGVHPHREPRDLKPGQKVKVPEVDLMTRKTHIYTSKQKTNQITLEILLF